MDVKELRKLLEALAASDVSEFTYDTGDYKLSVKRGGLQAAPAVAYVAAPAAPTPTQFVPTAAAGPTPEGASAPSQPAAPPAPAGPKLVEVQAPIVGTFYAAPAPDAAPFVRVGDRVAAGTVLCIIEAMKLMNEIESEAAGIVREVLVGNGEPVEYGQVLFRIEPA